MATLNRLVLLALAGLALGTSALAQLPPMLPEFHVSQDTVGYQSNYGVAIDNAGRFVVSWMNYNSVDQREHTAARLYDAAGGSVANAFNVAPSTTPQFDGAVAKDAAGRFVVAWFEGAGVMARRFDVDGTPLGNAFTVTGTADNDVFIASDDSGSFVVTWSRFVGVGPEFDVFARVYDSSGVPKGVEFPVNTYTSLQQQARGVARKGFNNQFVITWVGFGAAGQGVYAKIFDANGNSTSGDIHVNQGNVPLLQGSTVAMNGAGEFVVAWDGVTTLPNQGIFARQFDPKGSALDDEFPVAAYTGQDRLDPQIASDGAGNFIVTWRTPDGAADGDGDAVSARVYNRFGEAVSSEFVVNETTAGHQYGGKVAMNDSGTFVVSWGSPDGSDYGVFGRRSGAQAAAQMAADAPAGLRAPATPSSAPGNGVVEPGETADVDPSWVNATTSAFAATGTATDFSGPPGATYTLDDATADYGTIAPGATGSCLDAGDCYQITVSAPATRPVQHWDASLQETLSVGVPKTWAIHIGESFPDVATDNPFYKFIETLFHKGVTGGCAGGGYCPVNPVTRAQMAVFLLKSRFGSAHVPPPCTGTVFTDVPCTGGPFDPWIEELAALQVTGGCGGGNYCPNATVTRKQMAVFLLKTREGASYDPPDCTGIFADVPCTPGTGFSDWIEELYTRQITGGCSTNPLSYCPDNPNNRGQMAVFLSKTFSLQLYGSE